MMAIGDARDVENQRQIYVTKNTPGQRPVGADKTARRSITTACRPHALVSATTQVPKRVNGSPLASALTILVRERGTINGKPRPRPAWPVSGCAAVQYFWYVVVMRDGEVDSPESKGLAGDA
jgi:hypothetical protein